MTIRIFIALSALFLIACGASAQNVAGDWKGTLKVGPGELRLVLHISGAGDGLKATLDSIDQGATGIPVSSISLRSLKLSFTADSIGGSYEAVVNQAGTSMQGTWTQGRSLPLAFERLAAPLKTSHAAANPSDIDGAWAGTLDTPGGTLRLVFHIKNTAAGFTATLDSLDQRATGIPMTAVKRSGASLTIEAKQIAGDFEGQIAKDLTSIAGTWTQSGQSLPLTLSRGK